MMRLHKGAPATATIMSGAFDLISTLTGFVITPTAGGWQKSPSPDKKGKLCCPHTKTRRRVGKLKLREGENSNSTRFAAAALDCSLLQNEKLQQIPSRCSSGLLLLLLLLFFYIKARERGAGFYTIHSNFPGWNGSDRNRISFFFNKTRGWVLCPAVCWYCHIKTLTASVWSSEKISSVHRHPIMSGCRHRHFH